MKSSISVDKYHTYTGHKDCLYALTAIDDQRFASAGADGQVVIWNLSELNKGTIIAKIPASVYALHYDTYREVLIIGQNFEGIHIIDVANKQEKGSLKLTSAAIFDINTDQENIYVGTGDGDLIVVNADSLSVRYQVKCGVKNVRTIALDDRRIFVGSSDHYIRVFEKLHLTLLTELKAHDNSVFSIITAPGGNRIISGSRDAHIKIWDRDNLDLIEDVVAHMYAINSIAMSPDGLHFVTCSMDKSIKVWDADRYRLKKVIDRARHAGHGTSVNKVLWMKHKNLLVSCSDDRTISVWDINFAA